MTVPFWPADLPPPEKDNWQKSRQESRVKRNAEAGAPGYRRRFSSAAKQVNLSIIVNRSRKAVFDLFFEETTANGSMPFYMPDPTTDGWKLYAGNGQPLLTSAGKQILLAKRWLCLFGDSLPGETVVGLEFRMSFSVWVMP